MADSWNVHRWNRRQAAQIRLKETKQWQVLRLSHHIGHPHIPYRIVVQVLAAPLPIKLLANASGKAADDGPITWVTATQMEFLTPGFSLTPPWLLQAFVE